MRTLLNNRKMPVALGHRQRFLEVPRAQVRGVRPTVHHESRDPGHVRIHDA